MRIVSYNIQALEQGQDGVIETLLRLAPDLIALQEVDHGTARSGKVAQAQILAEALDMQQVYAGAMPFDGGEFGIAILGRGALHDLRIVKLPRGGQEEPRVACLSTCRFSDGRIIRFANVHLASDWHTHNPEHVRATQAEALLHVLREEAADADRPLFLAGDFNCDSTSEALLQLRTYARALHEDLPTYPASAPEQAIDHVFHIPASDSASFSVAVTRAFADESQASDHRPLVIDVVLDPG